MTAMSMPMAKMHSGMAIRNNRRFVIILISSQSQLFQRIREILWILIIVPDDICKLVSHRLQEGKVK